HGFGHLYEEQVWVPLLIKPPRGAGIAPRRVRAPVSLLDVAPTLADFLELPAPEDLRGRSLRPSLPGAEPPVPRVILSENLAAGALAARIEHRQIVLRIPAPGGGRPAAARARFY